MAQARSKSSDIARQRDSFLLYLDAENRSPLTALAYAKAIDQLADYLEANGTPKDAAEVTADDIRGFLAKLRADGRAPATRAQRYRSLQQFFKFLVNEGRMEATPFATMKPPTVPVQPPDVLTPEQLKRLLRVTSGPSFEERRDHAIIALFVDTGMRLSELANLKVDELDLREKIAFVLGKGARERAVPFGKQTARILDRYVDARARHRDADEPWLWLGRKGQLTDTGVEQMIRRRGREAGIVGPTGKVLAHPHLFRHTAAHQNLADGMSEGDLMSNFGWKSRSMVDRYGASAKAERAREAQRRHSLMDRLG